MSGDGGEEKVVCVTGASGYIASWIVKFLLERGHTVKATVRDPNDPKGTEHLRALDGANERLHLFKAELLEQGVFDSVVDDCESVFHTASPVILSSINPQGSSLIHGRGARVAATSTMNGHLTTLEDSLSARNLQMNAVLGRISSTTQELANYHSGEEDGIYLAYPDFHSYLLQDSSCIKELNQWFAKQLDTKIKNPNYKGKWKAPMIDNPDFKDDPEIYVFPKLKYVGVELWQVRSGTLFDNVVITDDPEYAKQLAVETWGKQNLMPMTNQMQARTRRRMMYMMNFEEGIMLSFGLRFYRKSVEHTRFLALFISCRESLLDRLHISKLCG